MNLEFEGPKLQRCVACLEKIWNNVFIHSGEKQLPDEYGFVFFSMHTITPILDDCDELTTIIRSYN